MQTLYKLNADELNMAFLDSVKALFPHKTIEVAIHEVNDEAQLPATDLQKAKFAQFPSRLTLTRDDMNARRPEYQTMTVENIVMPSRDERYER